MKTKITAREFRNLSCSPKSSVVRKVSLDGFLECRIFQEGRVIAVSVMRWYRGFERTEYFSLD